MTHESKNEKKNQIQSSPQSQQKSQSSKTRSELVPEFASPPKIHYRSTHLCITIRWGVPAADATGNTTATPGPVSVAGNRFPAFSGPVRSVGPATVGGAPC